MPLVDVTLIVYVMGIYLAHCLFVVMHTDKESQ